MKKRAPAPAYPATDEDLSIIRLVVNAIRQTPDPDRATAKQVMDAVRRMDPTVTPEQVQQAARYIHKVKTGD